jgi:F0F1-type ATP synthase assembly protein I
MFVPSVGFTLLGVWADVQLDTKPWLMVVGIVVGCTGAALLVKKQISGIESRKESTK